MNSLSFTNLTVMLKTSTAIRPHKMPRKINPDASFVPPKNKTIGKPKAETVKVPKEAPIILAVVNFVLSSLSSVILAVRDEYGTLTIVKQVLCNKFTANKKIKSFAPSNGGTQNSKIKEKANGIAP